MKFATAVVALLCIFTSSSTAQPRNVEAEARALYDRYATTLREGQRDRLARFYSSDGVHLVLDGGHEVSTYAGVDSFYRSAAWQPPHFFSWDNLNFRAVGNGQVLVSGFFRWADRDAPDTLRVTYAALLRREAGGLRIRMEHEMRTPPRIDTRLVGTWELVSTRITRNDSTVMQGGPPAITSMKILNNTHYTVITHRDGQFARAGGGRYTVSRDRYTESVDVASYGGSGAQAEFTFRLEGDRWITEGTSGAVRFRETWRRVR